MCGYRKFDALWLSVLALTSIQGRFRGCDDGFDDEAVGEELPTEIEGVRGLERVKVIDYALRYVLNSIRSSVHELIDNESMIDRCLNPESCALLSCIRITSPRTTVAGLSSYDTIDSSLKSTMH